MKDKEIERADPNVPDPEREQLSYDSATDSIKKEPLPRPCISQSLSWYYLDEKGNTVKAEE